MGIHGKWMPPGIRFTRRGGIMSTSTISARLSDGLRQQMYAEPTVVEETCQVAGDSCWWDSECCPGMLCNWFHCQFV
jgi:hypothetical protein